MPHNLYTLKDNVNVFKRRLKDFILKAFYSIDEYMANKQLLIYVGIFDLFVFGLGCTLQQLFNISRAQYPAQ
jgi:hypothetical protein